MIDEVIIRGPNITASIVRDIADRMAKNGGCGGALTYPKTKERYEWEARLLGTSENMKPECEEAS